MTSQKDTLEEALHEAQRIQESLEYLNSLAMQMEPDDLEANPSLAKDFEQLKAITADIRKRSRRIHKSLADHDSELRATRDELQEVLPKKKRSKKTKLRSAH